ncbi:MAG: hypothetical protein ABR576_03420 [Thermoanaerobaculia bacterium]
MSLIDDALKRAQSAQGGLPREPTRAGHTPLPLPDPRRGRPRRIGRHALLALIPVAAAAAAVLILWPRPEEETRRSEPSALALPAPAATVKEDVLQQREITPRLPPPDISLEVFVPPPAAEPRETLSKIPPVEEPAAPPPAPAPAPSEAGDPGPREMRDSVPREVSDPAPREYGVSVTRIESPGPPMVASGSPMIVRSEEAPPSPPPRARSEESQPSAPATARTEEAQPSAPARARSFVREATAPSGARLTLDGIVYSDENPAAVVSGRVVSVGSFVNGYEVIRIRPDRVELRDEDSTIVLLMK